MQINRRLRAAWLLVFWVLVGIGAYVFGVLSSTGQRVEDSALSASEFTTSPPAPLGLVSPGSIALVLVALGLIALWVHGIHRTLVVVLVPAAAIIASQLLKLQVLGRPDFFSFEAENTFPSGHMTVFVALTAAAVFAVPRSIRALTAVAGSALIGVAGWQLLSYGWHRPSDVIGALALGIACFAAATLLSPLGSAPGVWLVRTASIGLAAAGWLLLAAAIVVAIRAGGAHSTDLMLSAGKLGTLACCGLAAHSMLRLAMLTRSAKE